MKLGNFVARQILPRAVGLPDRVDAAPENLAGIEVEGPGNRVGLPAKAAKTGACSPMARHCSDQSIGRSVRRLGSRTRPIHPAPFRAPLILHVIIRNAPGPRLWPLDVIGPGNEDSAG